VTEDWVGVDAFGRDGDGAGSVKDEDSVHRLLRKHLVARSVKHGVGMRTSSVGDED
jgi:hypothetical protein